MLAQVDGLVLALVFVLSSLPFSQVVLFRAMGLYFSAFEIIYGALAVLLLFRLVASGRPVHPLPLALFAAALMLEFALGEVRVDPASMHMTFYQARFFMPFGVATLFLATGTTLTPRKVLLSLCAGTIVSAVGALAIRYLAPGFLFARFAASAEIADLAVLHGRLTWTNDALVLFAFCAVALIPRARARVNILIVAACAIGGIALFSTLDRTIIGGLLFYLGVILVGDLFAKRRIRLRAATASRLVLVGLVLAGLAYVVFSNDPRLQQTTLVRFPTSYQQAQALFQGDFAGERFPIYRHYAELPLSDYLIGQGLGKPLLTLNGDSVYTSDVSYMAFAIPFGILGLVTLAVFLFTLFRRLLTKNIPRVPRAWIVGALVAVGMLVSLNVDWLSRDTFVVYLTLLVMSCTGSHLANAADEGLG